MLQIVKRKVSQQEANLLVDKIKLTPKIVGYSVAEWVESENVMVAEDDSGEVLGACLNYDFEENWSKVAALFVMKEFRKKGIGRSLLHESIGDALKRKKNIYIVSSSPFVIKEIEDLNFRTFDGLFDLLKNNQEHKMVFCVHNLEWVLNFYRVKEAVRKRLVYSPKESFTYGLQFYSEVDS